jgi:hypothetical protein
VLWAGLGLDLVGDLLHGGVERDPTLWTEPKIM